MNEPMMRSTEARERPLLMSDPLVLQTESGIKTVTRRLMNPQPDDDWIEQYAPDQAVCFCPYGIRGDRLWLRHAHCPRYFDDGRTAYRCDWRPESEDVVRPPKWTPSILMRREYARTVVELLSVRVDRLLDITDADARREGVVSDTDALGVLSHLRGAAAVRAVPTRLRTARENFLLLWDRINGKREIGGVVGAGRAEKNPWVWRLEYRLVVCNGIELHGAKSGNE